MDKQQSGMEGGTLGGGCFYFHVGNKVGSYAKTAGYMTCTQSSGRKNIKGFLFFLKKKILVSLAYFILKMWFIYVCKCVSLCVYVLLCAGALEGRGWSYR